MMYSPKRILLIISGAVLLAANTMAFLYGFNVVKFDFAIEPQIIFWGHAWFFWFFVLLTMVFNFTFVVTVIEELRKK